MITLDDLDHSKTYIVGVSGGPDSMALFAMCIQRKIPVIAAHMNYQKRESAYRDMKLVEDYACMHQIPCIIQLQEKVCTGNFEAFARAERYRMYQELCVQYHAAGVLLAHHLDDHIETYLMQKERGSEGVVWGICDHTTIMDCEIYRPLLQLTKDDLLSYCKEQQVPYGIDETNLSDDFTRNRIRHQYVEPMSYQKKVELCQQIKQENARKQDQIASWKLFFQSWNQTTTALCAFKQELSEVLFYYVLDTCQQALSHHEIQTLVQLLQNGQDGWSRTIANEYEIYQEYGKLCIEPLQSKEYHYLYETVTYEATPFFSIAKEGSSTEAVTLVKDDFPITIRAYREGDFIQLRYGKKKLNRWFIDRKIPKKERKSWPVVINRHGNVILVPKIGCDIEHFSNNPTLFVLK